MNVLNYLDCGCAIMENGSRAWCPSCLDEYRTVRDSNKKEWLEKRTKVDDMAEVGAGVPPVTAKSYSLRNEDGSWLGQIILTSDGMFAAVTDWGNLCFAWRSIGDQSIEEFMMEISPDYLASKLMAGLSFIHPGSRKSDANISRFAEKILPALKKRLAKDGWKARK